MASISLVHSVPSLGINAGGPSRSVSQLCNALYLIGAKVRITTMVYPQDPIVPLDAGVNLTKFKVRGTSILDRLHSPNFKLAMSKLHRESRVSLVHQHGIWLRSAHDVITFANKHEVPLVLSPRGMLEPWAINNSKWKKKFAWAFYQNRDLEKVTAFHATARSEALSIRQLGFKQPIAVIPNGVHLPKITTHKEKISLPISKKKTALFLSRINPKKGLPMLLDAWGRVAPTDWRLVIAGNDDSNHLPIVERKIYELGLGAQVEIVGPLFSEAKEAAYCNADLFVLPSYSENFGIAVAEALSYALPVLTTTGCPWHELEKNNCGWWVEPTTKEIETSLRQALVMAPSQLVEMGNRGRKLVERRYQWHSIAEQMLEFYYWLMNGGKQPNFVV